MSANGGCKMRSIRWLLLSLLLIAPGWSSAAEDLPADKLVVQAKIPRGGDFMGFGFESLWMVSDAKLARVSAADNSVVDIELPGTIGKYRGVAVGEGAVWVPDIGAQTVYKVDPATNAVVGTFP